MTKPRFDAHSTEFGLWLRQQSSIDSKLGFVTTNLDYIWHNYKTGAWMAIEEKRFCAEVSFSQDSIFRLVDRAFQTDNQYQGLHILRFERTSPDDGRIWLNNRLVTPSELLAFLRFEHGGR